jgi:predicted porin
MQKKLLTMAVAGALAAPCIALAQSSVEVYGTINMAFGKFKYSESQSGAPSISKWDVSQGASNYGLRGRESLGGGLTAWFQIEQNAPMERSNNVAITPASRNSAVGIQGGFGNLFIGQWTTPWADLDALWGVGTVGYWGPITSIIGRRETTGTAPNPNCVNGHLSGSPLGATVCDAVEAGGGVGHPFWKRISQSIFYHSPVMGGVQAKFAYQVNDNKANAGAPTTIDADPSMWSAAVQWAGMGGRARIGAAVDRHKDFTTPGKTDTGWRTTGGMNFGVADVGLAYERMTYKTPAGDCKATQWGVALAVPVGTGTIRGAYSRAKDIEGDYTGAVAVPIGAPATGSCGAVPTAAAPSNDNGAKQWNLGYEHRFSKRTNVGVGYAAIKNDPGAVFTWTGAPPVQNGLSNTPLAGSDPSTWFVSITHRF